MKKLALIILIPAFLFFSSCAAMKASEQEQTKMVQNAMAPVHETLDKIPEEISWTFDF